MNGNCLISLNYNKATVLDSMLFPQTYLKNTINMLGLNYFLKKDYYPYLLTDLNYEDDIPEKNYLIRIIIMKKNWLRLRNGTKKKKRKIFGC